MLVPEAGTISLLRAEVDTAPGAGKSMAFALAVGGVASTLSASVADTNTSAEDVTHSVAVAAGDMISLRTTPTGVPTVSANARWSCQYVATAANRAIWGTQAGAPINTGVSYNVVGASAVQNTWDSTEANRQVVWATPCTIKSFYVLLNTDPGVGKSWTLTIRVNGVDTAATISHVQGDANTVKSITGLSVAVAAGDLLSISATPVGATPGSPTDFHWSISYAPTTDGTFNVSGLVVSGTSPSTAAVEYAHANAKTDLAFSATEANAKVGSSAVGSPSLRVQSLYVKLGAAPGAAKSFTFVPRVNGGSSTLSVQVTGAGTTTGNATGGTTLIQPAQEFGLMSTPAGTPTAPATTSWGILLGVVDGGASPGNSGNAPGRSRGNGPRRGGGGGGNSGGGGGIGTPIGGTLQKAFWGKRRRTR